MRAARRGDPLVQKLRGVEVKANTAVSGHRRFPVFYGAGMINDRSCLVMGKAPRSMRLELRVCRSLRAFTCACCISQCSVVPA